jgi:hypothetical protein
MSRSTIANILLVLIVAIMLASIGCSSAAPATTPAAKPVAPAATPATPAAAATSATPAAAPAKELSFKATTVTDDKNGFIVQHPKDWKAQEGLTGYYVYNAKPISGLPNFYVSVYPTTNADEISAISAKLYKDMGGTDLNYGKSEELNWGANKGKFVKLNWNYPGGYNLDTYSVTFINPKGDKTYAMAITVMADGINPDLCKEVFTTFQFK